MAASSPGTVPGPARRTPTRVGAVRTAEGEIRFSVAIGETSHEVWFTSPVGIGAPNEVAATAALIPALLTGGPLRVEAPLTAATLDCFAEAQAILRAWGRAGAWPPGEAFSTSIDVEAPVHDPTPREALATAAFFSGGADSLATVLRHPEITHLIHVEGFDLALERTELSGLVGSRIAAAARELGRELITVRTNLREFSDAYAPWVLYFGSALGAVALLLSNTMSRVMIGSGSSYAELLENGSHPLLDHLWGSDRVEVVHDGAAMTRVEKLELLAGDAAARSVLRVCWENPGDAYNCGRCEKCLRTMVPLEVLGVLDRFPTLPERVDPDAVATTAPANRPELTFWRENLELAERSRAAPELVAAIESCLANGRSAASGPRGSRAIEDDPRRGRLYISPEAAATLARAGGAAFLIGGYEGWGNYGDLLQLRAALDLIASELPGVAACPVLSLHAARQHAERGGSDELGERLALYHSGPGEETDAYAESLGLIPAVLPGPVRAAVWLYGGGYLNDRWGLGKLRMLESVRSLLRRMGQGGHAVVSSGLQIDSEWAAQVCAQLREALSGVSSIGVRDPLSARAATDLAGPSAPVVETGDDAVGALRGAAPVNDRHGWALNLHFCPGSWVSDEPDRARAWLAELVGEVLARSPGAVGVQPLIAYEDPLFSEQAELRRLCAEIAGGRPGIELREPLVLDAEGDGEAAAAIRSARLTVATSYHVALSSLLLGVPAILARETPYYEQKAAGLQRDFGLTPSASPSLAQQPAQAAARALADLGLDPEGPGPDLAAARERVLERRLEAEARLVSDLRRAFADRGPAPASPAVAITARERDALLGGLHRARARIDALEAQAAWQQDRLDHVTGSASWRLTAPIRALKAGLARGRGSPPG